MIGSLSLPAPMMSTPCVVGLGELKRGKRNFNVGLF
jgi:hypothetical protein